MSELRTTTARKKSGYRAGALLLVSVIGAATACASSYRYARLTDSSPLRCRSLNAFYEALEDSSVDVSPVPTAQRVVPTDPLLGWEREVARELSWCTGEARLPPFDRDCRFVAGARRRRGG